jgi:fructose-specific PTS system IIA-like component
MGGQTRCLPLLVGLGLDEISAAASTVTALKAELALWSAAACRELTQRALTCGTADEVRHLIDDYSARRPAPLVEPEMILVESQSVSKEEAIKEVVDQLYVLGRTEHPRAVEDAVWQRESVYSTGFGHGFAIPHCKTNAVAANSLVLLKLRHPVAWGSLDGQPVRVLLLLTVRESDQVNGHMKVFSRLARRVMHEQFREQLLTVQQPEQLCALLNESLSS